MMWTRTLAAAAVLASIAISAEAQSQSADERAIRDLIARYDRGESVASTDNTIYWTGPFKRPTVDLRNANHFRPPSSHHLPGFRARRQSGFRTPAVASRRPFALTSRHQGISPTNSATPKSDST